ncbi:MAG: hypothetical protein IT223_01790 [Crocinitomicaceae bacterium]|nr:hypothetical protein [Crocinitomicaceae bacterium]
MKKSALRTTLKNYSITTFLILSFFFPAMAQGVKISSSPGTPDPSSALEIESSSQGFLPPRLTTNERDAISSPAVGLYIFNTTTNCVEVYIGSVWQSMFCGCTTAPVAPVAGVAIPASDQIIWNWNAQQGAAGFKYNVVDNYSTATDLGAQTSFTQTGLAASQSYILYVWGYNACGFSPSLTLNSTTLAPPCISFTVNHTAGAVAPVSKTVTYETVTSSLSGVSKCWITRNLGSTTQATSATDNSESAGGWYWQFNRKQGYKYDSGIRTPNTTWITSINESANWSSANDPCTIELGSTWRIPTGSEWTNAIANGPWTNALQTYASVLKIHSAGQLNNTDGVLSERGTSGAYWSSTESSATNGKYMFISNSSLFDTNAQKSRGMLIRCIRD